MQTRVLFFLLALVLVFSSSSTPAAEPVTPSHQFVHPGVIFSVEDLQRLKAKKSTPPWSDGYAALAAKPQAALAYKMRGPFEVVGREPNLNRGEFENDCMAVFYQAIQWAVTGDATYAKKGVQILEAWAATHKSWSGGTPRIGVGEYGVFMVAGAEILRYTYPAWPVATSKLVEGYFRDVFWPLVNAGPTGVLAGANQGAMQLQVGAAIAVFCSDPQRMSDIQYSWYLDGAATPQNTLPNGQIGDMGRHQPHALIQIRGLALTAETFFKQGLDVYSELDNRLLAVGEYFSKYNLGNDIPFLPYGCTYGYYYEEGPDRRVFNWGNLPFEIFTSAYTARKGLPAPFMREYLAKIKPDENTFLFKNDAPSRAPVRRLVPPSALPAAPVAAWQTQTIGFTGGGPVSATQKAGVWTISGAGKSPENNLSFAYRALNGDGVLIARVTDTPGSTPATRAGLMIRASLDAKDPQYVSLLCSPEKVECSAPGGGRRSGQNQAYTAKPWWLRMERRGNRILAYHCGDGVSWSIIMSAPITAGSTVYAGFAVVSGDEKQAATATFDHVQMTPPSSN